MEEPGGSPDVVTQADLKLVRDQVDHLQVMLAKGRNPWYREPVNLTSAMAAVVAIVSLLVSSHQGGQQELREKREEFRSVLQQLVSMTDEEDMLEDARNSPEKQSRLNSLRTSRDLFRSSAEMLAMDLGSKVLFAEFLIMGDQFKEANDNKKAGEYYDKALRSTKDPIDMNKAHRRHAWLYSSLLLRNHDEMRTRFRNALGSVKDQRNDLMLFTAGNTYAEWGYQESYLKNYDEALERQKQAEQIFLRMSDEGRNKQSSLDRLRLDMGYNYMRLALRVGQSASYSLYLESLKLAEQAFAGISDDPDIDSQKQKAFDDLRSLQGQIPGSWSSALSASLRPFRPWPGHPLQSPLPMERPQHQADTLGLPQP